MIFQQKEMIHIFDKIKQFNYEIKEWEHDRGYKVKFKQRLYIWKHMNDCETPCENCDNLTCARNENAYKHRYKRLFYCTGQR